MSSRSAIVSWAAAMSLGLLGNSPAARADIAFVQSKNNSPNNSALSSLSATFGAAQSAGDLNVVALVWGAGGVKVTSITDTKGNTYALAVGPTTIGIGSASIYYAKNIAAATAGSNTVTVTFSAATGFPDLRIAEYRGIDTTAPLDVTAVATGTGTLATSASATTTNANDLLIGASDVQTGVTDAGAGYIRREISGLGWKHLGRAGCERHGVVQRHRPAVTQRHLDHADGGVQGRRQRERQSA